MSFTNSPFQTTTTTSTTTPKSTQPQVVEVNVSGTIFTTLDTLIQKIPIFHNETQLNQSTLTTSTPPPTQQQQYPLNSFQQMPVTSTTTTSFFTPQQQQQNPPTLFGFNIQQQQQQQQRGFEFTTFDDVNSFKTAPTVKHPRDNKGRLYVNVNSELFRYVIDFIRSDGNEVFLPNDQILLKMLQVEAQILGWNGTMNPDLFVSSTRKLNQLLKPDSTTGQTGFPLTSATPTQATQLLKIRVYPDAEVIVPKINYMNQSLVIIPHTEIEFDLPTAAPVLFEWSFKDSAGEFYVEIDGQLVSQQPVALGGILLSANLAMDYAMNVSVKYVHQFSSPGKHGARLQWKPYKSGQYNLEAPVILTVTQLDPSICEIVGRQQPTTTSSGTTNSIPSSDNISSNLSF
jgi:hypothetical protein